MKSTATPTAPATEISSYEKQAIDFLNATSTAFKAVFFKHGKHFDNDDKTRDIYKVTLTNKLGRYTFKFGQCIQNSNGKTPPTPYDVLACLQKYDPESYEDFCANFDMDAFSSYNGKRIAASDKVYKAVCKEYESLCRLFSSEQIEKMQEIQ